MQPFSFQFKHYPTGESFDQSLIEYDETLNLSIDKATGKPAISELNMATETFTRNDEAADSDDRGISLMMATSTETKSGESSDTDPFRVGMLMLTSTTTFVAHEAADSDNNQFC